jgi:hypothetical protein
MAAKSVLNLKIVLSIYQIPSQHSLQAGRHDAPTCLVKSFLMLHLKHASALPITAAGGKTVPFAALEAGQRSSHHSGRWENICLNQ